MEAIGISIFHSIAAFNNSGFDILGGLQNLIPYQNNLLLNLTTAGLIIFGGLGFLVILDILKKRSFRALALHSKVVIVMSAVLILLGTLLFESDGKRHMAGRILSERFARTAGFSTYPIGSFTDAGLFVLILLMFVGASPGSTGGGIKTTTLFALCRRRAARLPGGCPRRSGALWPEKSSKKLLSSRCCLRSSYAAARSSCVFWSQTSHFCSSYLKRHPLSVRVGLSTGITPQLQPASKLIVILIMYTGRIGPLTVASLWAFRTEQHVWYSEETITIG